MRINYKPQGAWAGDFIPFFWQGEYHLFYLLDERRTPWAGTPWYHLVTRDFVHFRELGEAIPRGGLDEQDMAIFTGCVLHAQDRFHIFYTGHNPAYRQAGKPEQTVMHAVSDDLLTWQKCTGESYPAPDRLYEPHDWRDPFVFWNEEAGEYWMLLAARRRAGLSRRRGCTALSTSKDLIHWLPAGDFYAPNLYYTHECPDLFKLGDWWYLIFSEFSEAMLTRYRMARSLQGPWLTPAVDSFDGRAFYAAKTAGDAQRRYLFGWNPTRSGDSDEGEWQWGGSLVTHELVQNADGTLGVRLPDSIQQTFSQPQPAVFGANAGCSAVQPGQVSVKTEGYASLNGGPLGENVLIELDVAFSPATQGFGLLLHASADLENGYFIRVEPQRGRLVFDRWPRKGDQPFAVELERPLTLPAGKPLNLQVYLNGTLCEVYVNGQVAMGTRTYNLEQVHWGLFVMAGQADFGDVRVAALLA